MTQHRVILSIGTNQGNRLKNIEDCLWRIHNQLATVVKVSKLYETASWGFDSTPFYNITAIIHTIDSAQQVLDKTQRIEKEMGRIREENKGYQSRIIDIDLIAFDSEIIHTNQLTIPHPLMQDRRFVLAPMMDLATDWVHPILNQTVSELLQTTLDGTPCNLIQEMKHPLTQIPLNRLTHLVIEGNIGVGKTTLAKKIAQDFGLVTILEQFVENQFLPKFYKDKTKYAFLLEMSFLADRYKQIQELEKFGSKRKQIVSDYHIIKSLVFAKITLMVAEYQLYRNLFDIMFSKIDKPDLYVFLYQNRDRLLQNIRKRARSYEQEISKDYLTEINTGYLEELNNNLDLNFLVIDVSEIDFVENHSDYIYILDKIKDKINSTL